jgi:hypothetical protein
MMEASRETLKQAIENLHNCDATYVGEHWVEERFDDDLVWRGEVCEFSLQDHPTAKVCFVWSSPVEGSEKRRFYAVLKLPPIRSASDAVKAAIVSDHKSSQE